MISTHPKVGMAVLVGVRVKAKVWALARRDAHSFGLGSDSVVFVSDYIGFVSDCIDFERVWSVAISDYIGL